MKNRRANLRVVDPSQSNANRARVGCIYQARNGRYVTRVEWRGRTYRPGTFDTEAEAEAAILACRQKYCPDSFVDVA